MLAALSSGVALAFPAHAGLKIITGDGDAQATDPQPGSRLAMVISTQDYDAQKYAGPEGANGDAEAVAKELRRLGYLVMQIRDADREKLASRVEKFTATVGEDSLVVIYYNGTGGALPFERDNRLIPTDFPAEIPDTPSAAWREVNDGSFALNADILKPISQAKPRATLLFYDGCRSDPFADLYSMQRFANSTSCSAERITDVAAIYASSGNKPLNRSKLAEAMISVLNDGADLNADALFTAVKRQVVNLTSGSQVPEIRIDLSTAARRGNTCIAPVDGACSDESAISSNDDADQILLAMDEYVPESGQATSAADEDSAAVLQVCDELAAHPGNTENPDGIKGVLYSQIDGSKALPACLKAVEAKPDSLRLRYQLARAKQAAGQEKEAIAELLALAEEDQYPAAMNNLGATYQVGIGVPKSYGEAARWYRVAAENGFVPSMAVLGWMYQSGRGVPKNNSKAFEWYQKAADGGAASAMHNLGFMHQNGWGTSQDEIEAARWFEKAAEKEFAPAMAMTGWLYQVGRGVPIDTDKAIKWYSAAASTGDPSAMSGLGGLYDSGGVGLAREPEQAAQWLIKALRRGHQPTRTRLVEQSNTLQLETRRAVQRALQGLGFDPGPADGVFGRKTKDAIDQAFTAP